jgi:helicase
MAIFATFIGIDKHVDPTVRNLFGARRDATALWSLFSDTVPDLAAKLLVDEQATIAAIRAAITETLGAAGPDDTVILSFSGHGTRDHRLVAYDTLHASLAATTLPMQELADAFRGCRARAVLCILDCCFSGGAPARVLEDSPVPRDPGNPLEALAGVGRILLAASNIDEFAYEHPRYRHGLLTYGLMEVLRAANDSIGVGEAMDRIMERVRADAGTMGIVQTPVLLGHVEGGLLLPGLKPGANFHRAFPEARGIKVGAAISDLSAFGLPAEVLEQWAAGFHDGLNDLQLRAVNDYRILEGDSLLVVAPTSSGKTFIGEMAATRAIVEGRKAVFLLPYRALVNEKYDQFQRLYGEKLRMRVVRCTGDYLDQTADVIRGKYDLALLTYEMFLNLAVSNPWLLPAIGLVVLDEAQFITDPGRGITVELLLTYLLASRERGIQPQLIALSAVIGNINDFDAWLGCASLVTAERPVPLVEGVLDRTGTYQFIDSSGQEKTTQLLPPNSIYQRREKPSAQDVIVPLVKQLVQ